MSDIRPGDRVRVVFPPKSVCIHQRYVETEGEVGVMDRLDARFGDHPIVVVFDGLRHPPFNDPWVDRFSATELERVEGQGRGCRCRADRRSPHRCAGMHTNTRSRTHVL